MEWKQGRPTEAGIHLRATEWGRVTRCDVLDVDGKLFVSDWSSFWGQLIPVEKLYEGFRWFGPIPQPEDLLFRAVES